VVTLDQICGWLDENGIAKMKWPEKLVIVDQMPLTPTRKIIKGELTQA
jgi:cyclohexanecarboxylate-CoA ligase